MVTLGDTSPKTAQVSPPFFIMAKVFVNPRVCIRYKTSVTNCHHPIWRHSQKTLCHIDPPGDTCLRKGAKKHPPLGRAQTENPCVPSWRNRIRNPRVCVGKALKTLALLRFPRVPVVRIVSVSYSETRWDIAKSPVLWLYFAFCFERIVKNADERMLNLFR